MPYQSKIRQMLDATREEWFAPLEPDCPAWRLGALVVLSLLRAPV